ncbi:MAG: 2-hydroxychromene-2-carboxylate isomerase [Alphaproteobacteria bacterium]|nr:2-hydroxychromene-2-carboxylate isomerase [Alphaproteobacteria bacterium]|tara:strand:+ start:1302 stop:2582 length:1281 start_codon:yes stop_codon:yes gene_type:complete
MSRLTQYLTSSERQAAARAKAERRRVARGEAHVVEYFHDASDPYSYLVSQILGEFVQRYDVHVEIHLVAPPPDWAAPEREQLADWSRLDAQRLAEKAGLNFQDPGKTPSAEVIAQAESEFLDALDKGAFVQQAARIGGTLWGGGLSGNDKPPREDVPFRKGKGSARREALGHYLGATFHYAGEWYWGLDRLHYLEARLLALGAVKPGCSETPIFAPPVSPAPSVTDRVPEGTEIHYYLSFRSPYTYIVAERVKALAQSYGARLRLRFVLPMVMRGLPVPRMKGMYITKDTAREARRLGVPFGKIADPVGEPVERGYSLLPWAISQERGFEFCLSFMRKVWSEGIDAGSAKGMEAIVAGAGLSWEHARSMLGRGDWRAEAEVNRAEMSELGLWGVPSFRVGNVYTWGQDRLWVIEDELKRLAREDKA